MAKLPLYSHGFTLKTPADSEIGASHNLTVARSVHSGSLVIGLVLSQGTHATHRERPRVPSRSP
jgi:hypothetical protein